MLPVPPRILIGLALAGLALAGGPALAGPPASEEGVARRPNVVLFLADDLGWGDLGCQGHPDLKTPHLDAFAQQGVRFTQCYAACGVCSPSRSSLLTGRTPYRNGVYRWIPAGHECHLRRSEITLATLLKDAGYATCHVGKWHLNGHFDDPRHPQPGDHGFDHWFATQNNAAPSHRHPTNFVRNGEAVGPLEGYSALLTVDEGIRWLRGRAGDPAPFFLNVWTHEPHLPIESDPQYQARYARFEDEGVRQHHGNVSQMDAAFGRMMAELDRMGIADRTLVFFTSDNGPEGRGDKGRTRGSTGGLRGRKRSAYEGGIRVPGLLRWPGHAEAGTVCEVPIVGSDFLPTVLDVLGLPLPERTLDGASIRPLLSGGVPQRSIPLYWRNRIAPEPMKVAMRVGDDKILADEALEHFELYDLAADPQERVDLAAAEPERLEAMKARLRQVHSGVEAEGPDWWRTLDQPRPAKLAPGEDETGDFARVLGGTVSRHADGIHLRSEGEVLALRPLDPAHEGRLRLRTRFRSLRADGTRNGALVFGPEPTNAGTTKVGTGIGMATHLVFTGDWNAHGTGWKATREIDEAGWFEVEVVVDVAAHRITGTVDGVSFDAALPKETGRIAWVGCYAKGTETVFEPIEVERLSPTPDPDS